jgi:hypothetical protein
LQVNHGRFSPAVVGQKEGVTAAMEQAPGINPIDRCITDKTGRHLRQSEKTKENSNRQDQSKEKPVKADQRLAHR